jgi:hypothetical protein
MAILADLASLMVFDLYNEIKWLVNLFIFQKSPDLAFNQVVVGSIPARLTIKSRS